VCINKHTGVAKVLVDADAEVEARCVCSVCVIIFHGITDCKFVFDSSVQKFASD